MRNGKARKEIYLTSDEQIMITAARKLTGLDGTNTMRLLLHIGFNSLTRLPDNVGNNTGITMKAGTKRILNGLRPANITK